MTYKKYKMIPCNFDLLIQENYIEMGHINMYNYDTSVITSGIVGADTLMGVPLSPFL